MSIMADLFLEGNAKHPHLQECEIFTRSLSWSPYIRNTYDSTANAEGFRLLAEKGIDYLSPETED